ncbi:MULTISPECIES: hypothetical protein [unclassified Caballeronia]|uniref:hypothetical protein n=1 Tax=unclassified Caballeronia TaxID=2646786 RepID=UPI002866DF43|nr:MULTISPECIES: hypothetical protein [unclassified Caballeronia]MDR5817512.1 hypothetical protein [Caballeronia sp. LZ033]MDR5824457.1 hypothetical protein [Caballeronia sp. LZ043]MDR5838248.1 hypothetical protein [Caballeronia sp. LZ034LL]MDR5882349.1 hypothetical protein [Caballeronia sp. LZ032]
MIGKLIGVVLAVALAAGCYALIRGHDPQNLYMDDNALLSRYLSDSRALAADSEPASTSLATVKHASPLLESQD